MRIIITGVTSFLGIYTAKKLLAEGHDVLGVVRPGSRNEKKLHQEGLENLRLVHFDFDELPEVETGTDAEKHYREVMPEDMPSMDAWIHFSWDGIGSAGRQDVDTQIRNIANAKKAYVMARLLSCRRFLFAGSQAEYGVGNHRMPKPVSQYGKAKLAFGRWAMEQSLMDQILAQNKEEHAASDFDSAESGYPGSGSPEENGNAVEYMQFIHMRIYSVYGYGDHPTSLVNTVIQNTQKGQDTILGPCTQIWNYLEIRDLARAIALLTESRDTETRVYDIAGSEQKALKTYVEIMHRIAGGKGKLQFGVRANNAEGAADMRPEIFPLQRLGFRQSISFEQGITELAGKLGDVIPA